MRGERERHKRVRGFTLTETLVSAFVMAILGAGLMATFLTGKSSYLTADATVQVQQEARRAFDSMVRELRQAGNLSTTALGNGSVQLNFQVAMGYNQAGCANAICWGDGAQIGATRWVHYAVIGADDNTRQLVRCPNASQAGAVTVFDGAACRVLANGMRHPNADGSALFAWDAATQTVTINLQTRHLDPELPTGGISGGVLTTRVRARNSS